MRRVVVLAEAAEDLEEARRFYDARESGVGDYCVTSLLADIESLLSHVVAVLDLRREPSWIRSRVARRQ